MAGVLLKRGNGENRFNVHEVIAEKEGAAPFWTGTRKGYPGGDTPSVSSILRGILNVKKRNGAEDTELQGLSLPTLEDTDTEAANIAAEPERKELELPTLDNESLDNAKNTKSLCEHTIN